VLLLAVDDVTTAALPEELVAPPLLSDPELDVPLFEQLFLRFVFEVGGDLSSPPLSVMLLVPEEWAKLLCLSLTWGLPDSGRFIPIPEGVFFLPSFSRLPPLLSEREEPVALLPSLEKLPELVMP